MQCYLSFVIIHYEAIATIGGSTVCRLQPDVSISAVVTCKGAAVVGESSSSAQNGRGGEVRGIAAASKGVGLGGHL